MTSTIALGTRNYSVEKTADKHELVSNSYVLTGPRGARYILIRRQKQPEVMFACAINGKWPTQETPFKSYVFTDKDGDLQLLRR